MVVERKHLALVVDNTAPLAATSENTLEKILRCLKVKDRFFDYNVPSNMRDPEVKGLPEFLVKAYSKMEFEITGEEAVKKYIRPYDFVKSYGDPMLKYEFYIKPGMKGVIKQVDLNGEYPLTILWEKSLEVPEEQELRHTAHGLALLPGFFQKQKITDPIELLSQAVQDMLVETNSKHFKYSFYVPANTKGIVTKIDNSANFPVRVVFGNSVGYIPSSSGSLVCNYGMLCITHENEINIRKLIRDLS